MNLLDKQNDNSSQQSSQYKKGSSLNQAELEQQIQEMNIQQYENRIITLGICAMAKKVGLYVKVLITKQVKAYPMQKILENLNYFAKDEIQTIIFDEEIILNKKIEEWPKVDAFFAFFSNGFPLIKAQKYQQKYNPFIINDITRQEWLWDRSKIYKELNYIGINLPQHYFVIRNPDINIIDNYKKQYEEEIRNSHKLDHLPEIKLQVQNSKQLTQEAQELKQQKKFEQENDEDVENVIKILREQQNELENYNSQKIYNTNNNIRSKTVKEMNNFKQIINKIQQNLNENQQLYQTSEIQFVLSPEADKKSQSESFLEVPQENLLKKNMSDHEEGFQQEPVKQQSKELKIQVIEKEDYLIINKKKLYKPFVEKPFDAEDHNINIYYPRSDGGGVKKLFRKIGNQSSQFFKDINEIRQEGNYIYEEFLPTEGFDIKVYTVGPEYAHAELRKSPTLDGKVVRNIKGKEERYPVCLTQEEKNIAKRIVYWFGQNICGFDLLRSKGKSYVCDVNGMSFVKGNQNYFQDCAILIRQMLLQYFCPQRLLMTEQTLSRKIYLDRIKKKSNDFFYLNYFHSCKQNKGEELKSIVAIFRHGDRTPKQKMKLTVTDMRFLQFFKDAKDPRKEIKLKSPKSLQKILEIAQDISNQPIKDIEIQQKFEQLKCVLFMGGHFEGINRKVQLKPLVIEEKQNSKGQIEYQVNEALFVLKWGGELTHAGMDLSENLGQQFRQLYPESILRLHSSYKHDMKIYSSEEGRCQQTAAAFSKGFLGLEGELTPIMVSLVRKDQEVQQWLDMQHGFNYEKMNEEHRILDQLLHMPGLLFDNFKQKLGVDFLNQNSLNVIKELGEPLLLMEQLLQNITKLTKIIKCLANLDNKTQNYYIKYEDLREQSRSLTDFSQIQEKSIENQDSNTVCFKETMIMVYKRWLKLSLDFYDNKNQKYNISKIPDIYDSICYDIIHNSNIFQNWMDVIQNIHSSSQLLHAFVNYYEFGIKPGSKFEIGSQILKPLLKKVSIDINYWEQHEKDQQKTNPINEGQYYGQTPKDQRFAISQFLSQQGSEGHVRTRVYFTSASHINSLLGVIRHGFSEILTKESTEYLKQIKQMGYLSYVVFKLYENFDIKRSDPSRFRIEISLSQGCIVDPNNKYEQHLVKIQPEIMLTSQLQLNELENQFQKIFDETQYSKTLQNLQNVMNKQDQKLSSPQHQTQNNSFLQYYNHKDKKQKDKYHHIF